jgi:sporulation protein YlmC with PRC-barrel domain
LISFDALLDKKVVGAGAYILGEVQGVSIDTKMWQISQLQIKLTDNAAQELGYKKRFGDSVVNMPVTMVQAVGDVINVSASLKELGQNKILTEFK